MDFQDRYSEVVKSIVEEVIYYTWMVQVISDICTFRGKKNLFKK